MKSFSLSIKWTGHFPPCFLAALHFTLEQGKGFKFGEEFRLVNISDLQFAGGIHGISLLCFFKKRERGEETEVFSSSDLLLNKSTVASDPWNAVVKMKACKRRRHLMPAFWWRLDLGLRQLVPEHLLVNVPRLRNVLEVDTGPAESISGLKNNIKTFLMWSFCYSNEQILCSEMFNAVPLTVAGQGKAG